MFTSLGGGSGWCVAVSLGLENHTNKTGLECYVLPYKALAGLKLGKVKAFFPGLNVYSLFAGVQSQEKF